LKNFQLIHRNYCFYLTVYSKQKRFIVDSSVEEAAFIDNNMYEEYSADNDNTSLLYYIDANTSIVFDHEYTGLRYTMKLRRVATFYLIKIIFPFTLITLVTLFAFWLAPDSGEKLTLNVTILLSLIFYLQMITEYIPRGYTKLPTLTLYSLLNFFFVFLSCTISVIVLR
jgi:hypothetical protein